MEGHNSNHISTEGTNPGNSLSLSREDILAIYEEGPDAVVALFQTIFPKQAARIAELEERAKIIGGSNQ